jgi:hypothetical protein
MCNGWFTRGSSHLGHHIKGAIRADTMTFEQVPAVASRLMCGQPAEAGFMRDYRENTRCLPDILA